MGSDKRTANAVGGKTARACDSCVRRRASWYCAADDAFLCQPCDLSVHSANPLARRHHRLRLNVSSSSSDHKPHIPTWPRGINTKPRTPRRHGKHNHLKPDSDREHFHSSSSVVPQLDDQSNDNCGLEDEDQLLYRVPMMNPTETNVDSLKSPTCPTALDMSSGVCEDGKGDHSVLFPGLEMDEFATDVETLLGEGFDGESYGIEELGLLDCHEEDYFVPVKAGIEEAEMEVMREPFELSFDYNYYSCMRVGDEKVSIEERRELDTQRIDGNESCGKISLRLDYKGIRAAWASKGSPWVDGEKPEINLYDNFWTHLTMEDSRKVLENGERGITTSGGGGREARVWRYKEKRRKRLFSKKIRYEVRKLNAEKRPRLKGRFVKICS